MLARAYGFLNKSWNNTNGGKNEHGRCVARIWGGGIFVLDVGGDLVCDLVGDAGMKAWALTEKTGGRAGKMITLDFVPFWFPLRTAIFATRWDAQRFAENKGIMDDVRVVRVEIKINKVEQ
jgi:hypothetical protein